MNLSQFQQAIWHWRGLGSTLRLHSIGFVNGTFDANALIVA